MVTNIVVKLLSWDHSGSSAIPLRHRHSLRAIRSLHCEHCHERYKEENGYSKHYNDSDQEHERVLIHCVSPVVIENGEVIGGAKAFVIIWSKIPKYKFLAKIFSFKPLFIIFHYDTGVDFFHFPLPPWGGKDWC